MTDALRTYLLPFPPSVNHYWKPARRYSKRGTAYTGRKLTDKAEAFRVAAIDAVIKAHGGRYPQPITGRLDVTITFFWPTLAVWDVGNFDKGVLDALTHAKVWHDDVQNRNLHQLDGEVVKGGCVLVEIRLTETEPVTFPEEFRSRLQVL